MVLHRRSQGGANAAVRASPDDGAEAIRVLLVEDSPDDAELLARVLEHDSQVFELEQVDNGRDLGAALDRQPWDIVISDYVLPGFSGLEALRMVRERAPRMPFIVVSGTVGEDVAVRALLDGADDYLLKDRLARLPLAIEQAVHRRSLESAYETASVRLEEKDLLSRAVLASLPALLAVLDDVGVIVAVNEVWRARSSEALTAPEVGTDLVQELIDRSKELSPRGATVAKGIEQVLRGEQQELQFELRWVDADHDERWTRLTVVPLRTRAGGAVVSQEDITTLIHARQRSDLAAAAFSSMGEAVVVLDHDLVPIEWNDAFVSIVGESASGQDQTPLRIVREALQPARLEETLIDAVRRRQTWNGQFGFRSSDGRLVIARATLAPIVGQPHAPARCVLVLDDITELRAAQARLEFVAYHDELTGLPNRVAFRRRVEESIERLAEAEGSFAWLLLVDINLLKLVNENLGHEVGDRYLQAVARRLREVAEPFGPVARVSGDEFALLLDRGEDAQAVARHVMEAFREPLEFDGRAFNAAISVGAARYPSDGLVFEDLLRGADVALRHTRSGPQIPFRAFERRMRANVERNLWTSIELPKALREGSLFLEYQPMMRLSDGGTDLVEALARWAHPERGRVGPGEFVEAADEVGLTRELGHYVLDFACRQLATWRQAGRRDLRIASNVSSALLLSRDFLPELDAILARYELAPGELQLEITEGALMADLEHAAETLAELRRRNIKVAIDDFGTGYSSLAYLRELRADTIKIAKPFVDRLPGTPEDRRIVEVIVHLATALGMRTVAEGVETKEQLEALSELACDEVQGYLIARPMPVADLERWIVTRPDGYDRSDAR